MAEVALPEAPARSFKDYKSGTRVTWCPGCGDFAVLSALYKAFAEMQLDPKNTVVVSGIGCSGRLPEFVQTYGFHGVHGRVLPTAQGVKLANPELTVVAVGGDGDGFAIGGGHVPHAARRNVDITYIVMDNEVYGLTKGQPSPTTPISVTRKDMKSKMIPYGVSDRPLNILAMLLTYGAGFVARGFSSRPRDLMQLYTQAIRHPGFAFVQALSPCPTFFDTYRSFKDITTPLPENWDRSNRAQGIELALTEEQLHLGVFYEELRPSFQEHLRQIQVKAGASEAGRPDYRALFQQFA